MKDKCLYCYEPVDKDHDFHARCQQEFFGVSQPPVIEYTLNQMDELAKKVIERSVTIPGVQPKLSMSLIKATKERSNPRLTVIDALGGQYIFKPPSDAFVEMPENEHVTMRIAEAFGIKVVPSSLIRLASGEISYITKRIDRTREGEKIHMLDMFQITEAYDKYRSSMERIGKALHKYSANTVLDKLLYFELALFSFLTGNNDMHLKNFSMIETSTGWALAPAYDLLNVTIVLPEDKEELALTLNGKKKKIKRSDFEKLGFGLELNKKQIEGTFKRLVKNKSLANNWLDKSFLSDEMKSSYKEVLEKKYAQLELVKQL